MREYLQSGKLRWKMGKSREYRFKRSIFSASHVSLQEDRTLAFPLIWSDVDFASKSARRMSCPGWLGVRSSFFFGSRWDTKGFANGNFFIEKRKRTQNFKAQNSHFCATWTSGMKTGLTWLVLYFVVLMGRSFGAGLEGSPKTSESETSNIKGNNWWLEDEFNLVRV